MQYSEEFLDAPDGHEIPVRMWRPKTVVKVLVIAHGMAEYCERYTPLADYLTEANIAVVALNHRGHGMDCPDEDLGHYADKDGWQKVINDLHQTIEYVEKELKDIPITLMGHSMGSFISQSYLQQHGSHLSQVILSSTDRINRPKLIGSKALITLINLIKGHKATSEMVEYLSFGIYNNKFKPNRTGSDWLSRDKEHVDAYVADPYCGFPCTLELWRDFIGGMLTISPQKWPNTLPVHLISGTDDPVGEFTKGISKLAKQIKTANRKLVTFKLYPGGRHELTNETNAEEVWQDIRDIVLNGELANA